MKTYIDLETYPRRSHFEYFRSLAYPYVGFTANVDVTNLLRFAKEHGGSGFHAILWATSRAANAVPQLRQRIEGDRIAEYDHCNVGHTVALPDTTFCNCTTDCRRDLEDFLPYAKACQEEAVCSLFHRPPPSRSRGSMRWFTRSAMVPESTTQRAKMTMMAWTMG